MTVVGGIAGQLAAVAERVGELDGRYLAVALLLQLATLAFRALAWRGVLAAAYPAERIPGVGVGCAYAAGVALNAFVPARGGEGAKVALVRAQIPGSSVATIAASLSVLLVLDAVLGAALTAVLWGLGLAPGLPSVPTSGRALLVAALVALALVGALVLALAVPRVARAVRGFLAGAARGLSVLRNPWTYGRTVLPFQLSAWMCRIAVAYFVLHAFHVAAGLDTAILLVVFTGLSTAVPAPGGAGSQQVLATFALQGVVSTAAAVSFSVGMQVGITAVNAGVGIAATMLLFRTMRPLAAIRAARTGSPFGPRST